MTERLSIIVAAPVGRQGQLLVRDAFEQILDLFELTSVGQDGSDEGISWRLVHVSMNSPLRVVAEAVSTVPGHSPDATARIQKKRLLDNLRTMRRGHLPAAWSHGRQRATALRVAKRAEDSVGRMIVSPGDLNDDTSSGVEVLEPDDMLAFVTAEGFQFDEVRRVKRIQVGSLEGRFLSVGTYYNKPAIKICERKSGNHLWCVISAAQEERISSEVHLSDVWENSRILVIGEIEFDSHGKPWRMQAKQVRRIPAKGPFELPRFPEFTDGLPSYEYLERLREGDFG